MSRSLLPFCVILVMTSAIGQAQVGDPGMQYSMQIAAGDGGQMYPYDRQDPWIHGHYQRVPAYGGFSSFRPYNYRHVFAQTQIASQWGLPHGMPYSQQYWNKYRGSYLQGNLHSQVQPQSATMNSDAAASVYRASYAPQAAALPTQAQPSNFAPAAAQQQERPIHVFPSGIRP